MDLKMIRIYQNSDSKLIKTDWQLLFYVYKNNELTNIQTNWDHDHSRKDVLSFTWSNNELWNNSV